MSLIYFESTAVVFDLSPTTINGWKILPLTYPAQVILHVFLVSNYFYVYVAKLQISKATVQQFQQGGPVPACHIQLEWIGEGQQKPLNHRVTILGAKAPQNVCYVYYIPQTAGMSSSV